MRYSVIFQSMYKMCNAQIMVISISVTSFIIYVGSTQNPLFQLYENTQ